MHDSNSRDRQACHRSGARRRAASCLRFLALGVVCFQIGASDARTSGPFGDLDATLAPSGLLVEDRLAILNLLAIYSHLADGLHTELFGQFFTEDALFEIVPYGSKKNATGQPIRQRVGKGRAEIVAGLRPRHTEFRREGVQRRHFLTNPVVWDQTDDSARVAVYLQLRTSRQGAPSELVATGRYEGRVVKTLAGWRMAEWTVYSDQQIE